MRHAWPATRRGGSRTPAAHYERRLPQIRAVADEDLIASNLDVHATVATVLGALPEIRALRAEMVRVHQLDQGEGVLILTDILGGTPANIATLLAVPGRVETVAGVNLPMLVRSLTYRHEPLATVVQKAVSGGQEGVLHVVPETENAARRS